MIAGDLHSILFHHAACQNWGMVFFIITQNPTLSLEKDKNGYNLLDYAIYQKNVNAILYIHETLKLNLQLHKFTVGALLSNDFPCLLWCIENGYMATHRTTLEHLKKSFHDAKDLCRYQKVVRALGSRSEFTFSSEEKAMFTAAECGDWETVFCYIDSGLSPTLKDEFGLTLLDYAYFDDNPEMQSLLKNEYWIEPESPKMLIAQFESLSLEKRNTSPKSQYSSVKLKERVRFD